MPDQSYAIAEALFLICVTIALFVPRVDGETSRWFSGDLSRPYRQCMLLLTCTLTTRCLFLPDRRFGNDCRLDTEAASSVNSCNLYYAWVAMESAVLAFLKLCMPFLLQRHLSSLINIVPGRDLQKWIIAIVSMDGIAIILTANVAPQFWALKRLGDALVFFPIVSTLRLYKRVILSRSTTGSFVLLDALMGTECCRFLLVVGASIGYALDAHDPEHPIAQFWIGLRLSSIFV